MTLRGLTTPIRIERDGKVYLQGCTYTSDQNLNSYAFWFVNGRTKINAANIDLSNSDGTYTFPDLLVVTPGTYQCVVYKKGLTAQRYASPPSEFVMQRGE